MEVYYLMMGIPLIISLLSLLYKRRSSFNVAVITVFFLILFILLALRATTVGTDLNAYEYYFDKINLLSFDELFKIKDIEGGYVLLNKIVGLFGENYQLLLVVIAFISTLPLSLFYRKNTTMPILTIVLFLTISHFNLLFSGLRQAIAIAIGVFAYMALARKRRLLSVCLCVFAMSFHLTSIVLFLMYPLRAIRIKKKHIIAIIVLICFLIIFAKPLFQFALSILPDKYKGYALSDTGAYTFLVMLMAFLLFSFVVMDEKKADNETFFMRNILVVATLIQVFASVSTIAMRVNYYFLVFIPALIPKIIENAGTRDKKMVGKVVGTLLTVFFIFYFFYSAHTGEDILKIFDYRFFWEIVS